MNRIAVASAAAAVLISGCAATTQNLTASDLRTPEYAYRAETLTMTVKQARDAVFEYGRSCRTLGHVDYDPTGNGRMYISIEGMGLTKASVWIMIDLDGTPDGKTDLHTYTATSLSHKAVDEIIDALKDPHRCA